MIMNLVTGEYCKEAGAGWGVGDELYWVSRMDLNSQKTEMRRK